MGENVWRDEQEWPLARTRYTSYYLRSQGQANSLHGDGRLELVAPADDPPDRFVYDPDDPVPTCGGNTLIIPMGVQDQRQVETRQDVLVYTSAPMPAPLSRKSFARLWSVEKFDADASYHPMIVLSNLFRRAMQYMLWVFTAAIFQSLVQRAGSECA